MSDRLANVEIFPKWKDGAPAHERLRELALFAEKNPDLFEKWVLIYAEDNDQRFKCRYMSGEQTRTSDAIGLCASGMQHIWNITAREYTGNRSEEA